MRRVQELVERLSGTGDVQHEGGAVVGRRRYELVVTREILYAEDMAGHSTRIEGLFSIEGSIAAEGFESYSLVGKPLILRLEDGRRFPFFLQHSNGTIAARGALR